MILAQHSSNSPLLINSRHQLKALQMIFELEIGVILPGWKGKVERHFGQTLPQTRHQMEALLDRAHDVVEGDTSLENQRHAHVERIGIGFVVEIARVQSAKASMNR